MKLSTFRKRVKVKLKLLCHDLALISVSVSYQVYFGALKLISAQICVMWILSLPFSQSVSWIARHDGQSVHTIHVASLVQCCCRPRGYVSQHTHTHSHTCWPLCFWTGITLHTVHPVAGSEQRSAHVAYFHLHMRTVTLSLSWKPVGCTGILFVIILRLHPLVVAVRSGSACAVGAPAQHKWSRYLSSACLMKARVHHIINVFLFVFFLQLFLGMLVSVCFWSLCIVWKSDHIYSTDLLDYGFESWLHL